MKKYHIIISPEFRKDIICVRKYILQNGGILTSNKFYTDVKNRIIKLSEVAQAFEYARESDSFPGTDLRQFIHKSYRIVYSINETNVKILSIVNCRINRISTDKLKDI